MELLSEIFRIKNLMSLNEATNPIYGFLMKPYLKSAWDKISKNLSDDALEAVPESEIKTLAKRYTIPNYDSRTVDDLVDELVNLSTLSDDSAKLLVNSLINSPMFNESLVSIMKEDSNFTNLMKRALEYEGENMLTPNEIKAELANIVGIKNANLLYNDMKVMFNPSKIKPTKSQYSLPPYIVDDLFVSTTDPGLQKTIKSYLTDVDMNRIFKEASDLAEKGTVPADFFKTEFEKIRSQNPKFWTELKRGEFMNVVKYLWSKGSTIWAKIPNKIKYLMLVALAVGVAYKWSSEKFSEGADPAFALGLKNCLIEKGYDSKEKIQDAKKNDIQKYNADLADCKTAVRAGAYGKGVENLQSFIPKTGTSSDEDGEIDPESLFNTTPAVKSMLEKILEQPKYSCFKGYLTVDSGDKTGSVKLSETYTVSIEESNGVPVVKYTSGPGKDTEISCG